VSDGLLQLNPSTLPGGKIEDVEELIGAGGENVIRQRLQVTGATLAEIARVLNLDVDWSEYALATRPIPPRTSTEPTLTQVSASIVAAVVLPANSARKGVTFQAQDITNGSNCYLRFGAGVSTSFYHVRLVPGAYYELISNPLYTGNIEAVWDGTIGFVNIGEIT